MLKDLKFAARQLLKSPLFTMLAIMTIALGIGANTAIFSVVNGVLINPLPYPNADGIAVLFQELPSFKDASISYPNFLDWQRMNQSFSALAAYRPTGYNLSGEAEPEHLHGEMVSAGFFEIFGVKPILGRTFSSADDQRGAGQSAMISESLWKRRFGGNPDIIGRRLILDGVGRTVIGIVPGRFHLQLENFQQGRLRNDIYTPIGAFNEPKFYADRSAGWGMKAAGLLKPGMTFEVARQDMSRVSRELSMAYPNADSNQTVNILTLKEATVGEMRMPLLVLLGAVTFVLLIACVNVSNLLLARATSRQREFAVRIAVGGSQWQIIRQLLTESILLSLAGGGLGLLLAQFGTAAAIVMAPQTIPRADQIGLDFRVLLFTLAASLLAGCAFGLAPALKLRDVSVGGALKETGRSLIGSRNRTQQAFVITEMALALVLLFGAGLMIRTMFVLWQLDPGFNPRGVETFDIALQAPAGEGGAAALRAQLRQIHEQIAATPGVRSASLSAASSPMRDDYDFHIWFVGRPRPEHQNDLPMALTYVVEPDYLKTFQIGLKRGRFLNASDTERTMPVAVIDESLAQKYYAGQDPIGQFLEMDPDPSRPNRRPNVQIVGVVGHVNQWGLDSDATRPLHAQLYLSTNQMSDGDVASMAQGVEAFVRGDGAARPSFELLRQRMLSMSPQAIAYGDESMEDVVQESIASKRFTMSLLAVFAGLALLLAGIGIYGVLSYLVGQRTREIGIRIALGAARGDVLGMILKDGARMTLVGIGIGVAAALALARLMSSVLFGVKPTDGLTFLSVILILSLIAITACYVPARRAMKIDPLVALRDD